MKKGDYQKKNGFTIIEVALVLAIAGLIFLMVFVALPQLQRQQRDSRRRDDILSFLETVKKYQTNNRGALPTDWNGEFRTKYLDDAFVDPDGSEYRLQITECDTERDERCTYTEPDTMDHILHIFTKATCNGAEIVGSSNPRNIAVLYKLEGAGTYCANT
ncbi:prepilin-type N-terminal cleavage/methylation domain-containing protein [Candidatus Saccharibacteria bacterium]|nr:prepilin-type N-terminal cleavage/methylation domain-containing protein [Candidatus Saccharibacteria bacterium]